MRAEPPTSEQVQFAKHDGEAFVEACPGAGKTRTIVARLKEMAGSLSARRGVAVLSFTNSAVEEFAKRSREEGIDPILRYPSFVGTFDSFVRHFVVLPSGINACPSRPMIVDSWGDLGIEIRLSGKQSFAGDGVNLDKFDSETHVIDPARINHTALQEHIRQNRGDYERAAAQKRHFLHAAGYLSADDARVEAGKRLSNTDWSSALGRAVAARFFEAIVDEAQDCNPPDIEILNWLRRHGVRVTVVCDPDQSIFGFRRGTPSNLKSYASGYRPANQLRLTGNFRCSPAICGLSATLRDRHEPDQSLGKSKDTRHPIIIAGYTRRVGPEIGKLFVNRLEGAEMGLLRKDAIILAHGRNAAMHATGDAAANDSSEDSRVAKLARAIGHFWAPSASGRSRESSLRAVERLLLHLTGHWQNNDHHPTHVINRVGLNARQLRRQALELIKHLPDRCDDTDDARKNWIRAVQAEFARLQLVLPSGTTIPSFFPCRGSGDWSHHLKAPAVSNLACSTIHEAKGREYEAVCVVIPPNRAPQNRASELFDAWEGKTESEAKRVIYVGVTRAKRLVMLAVPEPFVDRCVSILNQASVSFELVNLQQTPATKSSTAPIGKRANVQH